MLRPVLELFAGSAAFSKAMCKLGFTVHAYDIQWGRGGDILDPIVFRKLKTALDRKTFSFVHFGMPCESWSRARKWNGGPPPLRDNDSFLYGYDYLTGSNRIRVEQGNALLKATFLLALAAIAAGTPWTIENPFSSRAWLTFEMTKLQELGALPQQVHYCQYGKPWKKATTFLGWKIPSLLLKQCAGSFGQCSASGRKHLVLEGRNSQGVFRTLLAQPYPKDMVADIAAVLFKHLQNL